jgi:hypothetical protein
MPFGVPVLYHSPRPTGMTARMQEKLLCSLEEIMLEMP